MGMQLRMDRQWPSLLEMDVPTVPWEQAWGLAVPRGPQAGSGAEEPPGEVGR